LGNLVVEAVNQEKEQRHMKWKIKSPRIVSDEPIASFVEENIDKHVAEEEIKLARDDDVEENLLVENLGEAAECPICLSGEGKMLKLKCKHLFHEDCLRSQLKRKFGVGEKMNFGFMRCGICREEICHRKLKGQVFRLRNIRNKAEKAAMRKLHEDFEEKEIVEMLAQVNSCLDIVNITKCGRCKKGYVFDGYASCQRDMDNEDENEHEHEHENEHENEDEDDGEVEREEDENGYMVEVFVVKKSKHKALCEPCKALGDVCLHGNESRVYKCMYCCERFSTWNCGVNDYYCDTCHEQFKVIPCDPKTCLYDQKHPVSNGGGISFPVCLECWGEK